MNKTYSQSNGGVIFVDGQSASITVNNLTLNQSRADMSGGFLYSSKSSSIDIQDSQILNSSSKLDGSLVASYSSLTSLKLKNNILDCSGNPLSSFGLIEGLIN